MPIYEYRCDSCGHQFETIQKVSEPPLQACPQCEKNALVKKVSAAGFRLKGGGWYETDFKSGNKRNVSGDAKEATEKSSAPAASSASTSGDNGSSGSSGGSTSKSADSGSSTSAKKPD